jgi:hypothetical protein
MSRHVCDSDCRHDVEELVRIADAVERIANVVNEWADANRTPRMVVDPPQDFGEQVIVENDLGRRIANGEKPRWWQW